MKEDIKVLKKLLDDHRVHLWSTEREALTRVLEAVKDKG